MESWGLKVWDGRGEEDWGWWLGGWGHEGEVGDRAEMGLGGGWGVELLEEIG